MGKSTWARTNFPTAKRLDLLDERVYQAYLRDPHLFGDELRRQRRGDWVVVDEVQRPRCGATGACRSFGRHPIRAIDSRHTRSSEILQDTHPVRTLPASAARLRVRERTHPKLYVHTGERAFTTAEGIEALPPDVLIRELADGRL